MFERLKIRIGNSRVLERFSGPHSDPAPGSRVAVHLPNHLGDNVMSIPLVHSLVKDGRFDLILLAVPEIAPLWKALGYPATLIELPKVTRSTFRASKERLESLRISHSILLATGEEIAWLHLRAGARNRIGYDFWGRGFLLTKRLISGGRPTARDLVGESMVLNYLELLRAIGVPAEIPSHPWIALPAEREDAIAVSQSARSPTRWLPTKALADALETVCREAGSTVWLLGEALHRELAGQLRARGVRVEDFGGRTSVGDLMTILSRARAFVGPDSGTAHVAAAVGAPCLTIFTSGAPVWSSPCGERVEVLASAVECSPCFGNYTCSGRFDCLGALNGKEIAARLSGLLAVSTPGAGARKV